MTTNQNASAMSSTEWRVTNKGKGCSSKGCSKTATVKGLCPAHYAAERRKDPGVKAKAREASRRAHAKRQAAAKEA